MPLLQSSYLVDPPQHWSPLSLGARPNVDQSLLFVSRPHRPEDRSDQERMFWSQSHSPLNRHRHYLRTPYFAPNISKVTDLSFPSAVE